MTDFWFIFGAMVIDPTLRDQIVARKPYFERIGATITEISAVTGTSTLAVPAAGYLQDPDTTNMRGFLRDWAAPKYKNPPVISLYTAGKMCQLANTFPLYAIKSIDSANAVFVSAAKGKLTAPYSTDLATLLGAIFIDHQLASAMLNKTSNGIAKEFGIDPAGGSAEWDVISTVAGDPGLAAAHTDLFSGRSWVPFCGQVMIYYDDFKRAVY
jgi:hypothetical protein